MPACPVCAATNPSVLVSSERLHLECQLRERFVRERLTKPASPDELKDLTDFFHQENAEILRCANCSLLLRHELEPPPAEAYSEDEYDPRVMEHQYPSYLEAFRAKEKPYRGLLPEGARILEVGSHYGAFLQTAQEWGWRAEGVDVGKDTTRFARSKGFTVHDCELTDCNFPAAFFEGVFIWNCFEQIPDSKPLLAECRRLLKPGGVLVLRTPNGLFYDICQTALNTKPGRDAPDSEAAAFLNEAMGYNNLLGFPYLYGHNRGTLNRLVEPLGFRSDGVLNSELLTLPLPESPEWVERQERTISRELRLVARSVLQSGAGVLTGPWIEVWFRKT
jgi:SAM-dependent methyltransferase